MAVISVEKPSVQVQTSLHTERYTLKRDTMNALPVERSLVITCHGGGI